ncbi:maltokinase N-terminal cap-like domain-containing protein [Paeniglutamicibacter antarcticus]|uniref:maltokinase N-terminal cap-like domain-containing protein n=1 Tax=Paeniglutamicibacter antarcticus TaxID=494023 RepID=UPI0031E966DD
MSVIYDAIMNPTKNELIAAWLPRQEWFQGAQVPVLETVGGFRLDDPADAVGMEFIVVVDNAPQKPVIYHVPLTYRGAALPGGESALLGTSEHSVLGTRWIYDGPEDPVWQEQVRAFLAGTVQAQHQNDSHTLEPLVTVGLSDDEADAVVVDQGAGSKEVRVIRRPVAEGTASSGASSWVASPWLETGQPVRGAVIEFS